MTGATTWCVVYNGSEGPQVIDEEGHALDPAGFGCVRRSVVRDLIEQGRLIVVDTSTITDVSNPAAKMAAEDANRRNAAIDAEREQADTPVRKTVTRTRSSDGTK